MSDLLGRNGPALDGSPSTETHVGVASPPKEKLSDILSKLPHLNLTGRVTKQEDIMKDHGGYCDVFVGYVASEHLPQRTIPAGVGEVKVAVKRLRVNLRKYEKFAKTLAREMGVWAKLEHPNILSLLGYKLEHGYPSFVSQWIEHGTVVDYLKDNPECNITHLALGIAKGLEYMHDKDNVHSDLKGVNVLIDQSDEPLICDFGISRMLDDSEVLFVSSSHDGSIKGSTRWMAPELLPPDVDADTKHTKESDIWAYGMTLYELISKKVPYHEYNHKQVEPMKEAIVGGNLPTFIDMDPSLSKLSKICYSCWKKDPNRRLTMAEIMQQLALLEWRPPQVQHEGVTTSFEVSVSLLDSEVVTNLSVTDSDTLDAAGISSISDLASTGVPSPGATDGNDFSFSSDEPTNLQQEDDEANSTDSVPTLRMNPPPDSEADSEVDHAPA